MTVEPIRVCFVCLGNICRSPTAEGVMRHLLQVERLEDAIEVDSAGTSGWHEGEAPDARSREEAQRRGFDLQGSARQVRQEDYHRFDYLLAMDRSNLEWLTANRPPDARAELRLLRSFEPGAPPDAEVPDPYYGGEEGFRDVYDLCERACRGLVVHLRQR